MKLHSTSFIKGQNLPDQFAFCKPDAKTHVTFSENRNPHLAWDEVPSDTQSFVLMCVDADVPSRADDLFKEDREIPADLPRVEFTHWVMIDISADVREIAESACSEQVSARGKINPKGPLGARQGLNDYTGWFAQDENMRGDYVGYDGPCPPWNDALIHRYHFRLFALKTKRLIVPDRFSSADVFRAMHGQIVAEASTYAQYTLNQRLR
jgi:Raf kinase inhibitor-like YbhB/YbcL family protein